MLISAVAGTEVRPMLNKAAESNNFFILTLSLEGSVGKNALAGGEN